jgi:hypothetical protein
MDNPLLGKTDFLRGVFDAIPAMLLIVDDDIRIMHLNSTASNNLNLDIGHVYKKRGGDVLHCIHSTDVPEGCGSGPACKDCLIRNSVTKAIQGNATYRLKTNLEVVRGGGTTEMNLLLTASPFHYENRVYVLLTLEDISELLRLRSLLPICAHCKKIKNTKGYWKEIADYLSTHLDVEFSHGLCDDCSRKLYPDYQPKK